MKNYLVFCALISSAATAQVSQGALFASGSLTGSSQKLDYTQGIQTKTSTTITPAAGFFLSPSFAIGVELFYTTGKTVNKPDGQPNITQTKNHSAGISPFARYYIPIAENFFFAIHGKLVFGSGKSYPPAFVEIIDKSTATGVSIAPMLLYFPTSHWSVEASLGSLAYVHTVTKTHVSNISDATSKENVFGLNAGQVSLGVVYYFNKNKK